MKGDEKGRGWWCRGAAKSKKRHKLPQADLLLAGRGFGMMASAVEAVTGIVEHNGHWTCKADLPRFHVSRIRAVWRPLRPGHVGPSISLTRWPDLALVERRRGGGRSRPVGVGLD